VSRIKNFSIHKEQSLSSEVLPYGSELCAVAKQQQNRFQVLEIELLRGVSVYRRTDHITDSHFHTVMALTTLLYGSRCWTLTNQQNSRTQAAEVKLLTAVAGYRKTDHISLSEVMTLPTVMDTSVLSSERMLQDDYVCNRRT
jgi:hypothetical protein